MASAGAGRWRLQVAGSIVGNDFELDFGAMQGTEYGVRLFPGASTVSLRDGLLAASSSSAAAALLSLTNGVSIDFYGLAFEDRGSAPFINVATTGSPPLQYRIFNYEGNLGGPTFESDPNGIVEWVGEGRTTLDHLTARGGLHRIGLDLATSREVNSTALQIHRAASPTGPFTPLTTIAPLLGSATAGASYTALDSVVSAPQRFYYRVYDDAPGLPLRLIGEVSARAWPSQIGNAYFVGPGGYVDIPSAVAAAPDGAYVVVTAGTYPAFTLSRPVRIVGDGSGPVVIDTTSSRLIVSNIPAGVLDLAIYDLVIGSANGSLGMQIVNCDCVIVLDGVAVTVDNQSTALRVDDSPRVALQEVALQGGVGLDLDNQATVYASNCTAASLRVQNLSYCKHAGSIMGSVSVDPGSTVTALAGTAPRLDAPLVLAGLVPSAITITSDPIDIYAILLGGIRDFRDLSALFPLDMVLLLDQTTSFTAAGGLVAPSGTTTLPVLAPDAPATWGGALSLQVVVLRPATLLARFGNVRDILFVP